MTRAFRSQSEHLGVIGHWRDTCLAALPQLATAFYDHLFRMPGARGRLEEHSTVERHQRALADYATSLLSGRIDDEYIQLRRRMGVIHERIDLDTHWFIGMYEVVKRGLIGAVRESGAHPADVARFADAVALLVQVDLAMTMTTFTDARQRRVQAQRAATELSSHAEQLAELVSEFRLSK